MRAIEELKKERQALVEEQGELELKIPELKEAFERIRPVVHSNKGPDPEVSKAKRLAMDAFTAAESRIRSIDGELSRLDKDIAHAQQLADCEKNIAQAREDERSAASQAEALTISLGHVTASLSGLLEMLEHEAQAAQQGEQQAGQAIAKATASGDAKAEKAAQTAMDSALDVTRKAAEKARSKQAVISGLEAEAEDLRARIDAARKAEKVAKESALKNVQISLRAQWDELAGEMAEIGAELLKVGSGLGQIHGAGMNKLHVPIFAPNSRPLTDLSLRDYSRSAQ